MNTETAAGSHSETRPRPHEDSNPGRGFLSLEWWEIGVIALSLGMIAFVAIPNYFSALDTLRGKECSRRLQLVANSLAYLAKTNNIQPGEKICEPLDLNRALDLAQGALSVKGDLTYTPAFFRYGTEPDCADNGDHIYNFVLGEDGQIVPPRCSLAEGPDGEYYRERGLHVCDMEKVDGNIYESEEAETAPEGETAEVNTP